MTTTPTPPDPTRARGAFVLDLDGRQTGKTWRALDWVSRDTAHRVLVVATAVHREHAVLVARADWPNARWNTWNVLTAGQARAALGDRLLGVEVQLWVDDVDVVLGQLLGGRHRSVVGASITGTLAGDLAAEPADDAP